MRLVEYILDSNNGWSKLLTEFTKDKYHFTQSKDAKALLNGVKYNKDFWNPNTDMTSRIVDVNLTEDKGLLLTTNKYVIFIEPKIVENLWEDRETKYVVDIAPIGCKLDSSHMNKEDFSILKDLLHDLFDKPYSTCVELLDSDWTPQYFRSLSNLQLDGFTFVGRYSEISAEDLELTNCKFVDAFIMDSNFEGLMIKSCRLDTTVFMNCTIDKSILTLITIYNSEFQNTQFLKSEISDETVFSLTRFIKVEFHNVTMKSVEFLNSYITNCLFSTVTHDKVKFASTRFWGNTFTYSTFPLTVFELVTVYNTDFESCDFYLTELGFSDSHAVNFLNCKCNELTSDVIKIYFRSKHSTDPRYDEYKENLEHTIVDLVYMLSEAAKVDVNSKLLNEFAQSDVVQDIIKHREQLKRDYGKKD